MVPALAATVGAWHISDGAPGVYDELKPAGWGAEADGGEVVAVHKWGTHTGKRTHKQTRLNSFPALSNNKF